MVKPALERIQLIDVLRGFALLGIIIVHFVEQYFTGAPPQKAATLNTNFIGDEITVGLVSVFIVGKFYMIFSFLFGLSFFIQFSKSDGSSSFYIRFLWRLVILFALGWLHSMHFPGDILTIYAILGIGLLLLHKLPDKTLLVVALVMVINLPSFFIRGAAAFKEKQPNEEAFSFGGNDKENEKYFDTLKGGNYYAIIKANIPQFNAKMRFQVESGRLYITLGLFLLGLYAGRKKWFENLSDRLGQIKRLRKFSLWTMLALVVIAVVIFGGSQLLGITLSNEFNYAFGGLIFDAFNAALALLYVVLVIILYQREKWQKRLLHFYEVGRMGLTTYLVQSVFGVLIFFGLGLNLLNEIGAMLSLFIALTLFSLQIIFSKWWLSAFNYGPFEWLWRSFTYLKIQPLRKREVIG